MLVDDDEDTRLLLGGVLGRRVLAVLAVDSAQSCLARLADDAICIVATDVQMPGMSGIELCRVLRERYPGVVVIVLSGLATPSIVDSAMQAGAFAFLAKPVTTDKLERVLRLAAAFHAAAENDG